MHWKKKGDVDTIYHHLNEHNHAPCSGLKPPIPIIDCRTVSRITKLSDKYRHSKPHQNLIGYNYHHKQL